MSDEVMVSVSIVDPIKLRLVTERIFRNRNELKEYCESMVEQGVYTSDFWPTLFVKGEAAFSTLEPANETVVTTRGFVDESAT